MPSIEEVIDGPAASLMDRYPDVVQGVGQTERDGQPCVLVMLNRRSPEVEAAIPRTIEGYRVVMEVTGDFQAEPG